MDNNVFKELLQSGNQTQSFKFKKYLTILLEKKVPILIIAILVASLWIMGYSAFIKWKPSYTTKAILRFDNPKRGQPNTGVKDLVRLGAESKIAILRTSSVLGVVVDSLRLNFILKFPDVNRDAIFKKINILDDAEEGKYSIKINGGKFNVNYFSSSEQEKTLSIKETIIEPDSLYRLVFGGFDIVINKNLLEKYGEIIFSYIPRRSAIKKLQKDIETELDKSKTILTISYSNKDPQLAANVTNSVAKIFLEKLLEYKRFQTGTLLKLLEKQLITATKKLEKSQTALRKFREQNPYIILSGDAGQVVSTLVEYEKQLNDLKTKKENLDNLLMKNSELTNFEGRALLYAEILSFLSEQGYIGAKVISDEYQGLLVNREKLLAQYSSQHPFVVEVEGKIQDLQKKIDNRVQEYLNQLTININKVQKNINFLSKNLRNLPSRELKLAELQRNNDINEKIVSNLQVKYNEARISDAAIVPDAYIIEDAYPPERYPKFFYSLIKYVTGIFVGLLLGISLILGYNLINPTVRESSEVEEKLKLPVLTKIPVIGEEKKIPDPNELQRRIDPKLVTSDYSPTMESEAFRILRTKLALDSLKTNNALIISSLNPGEGKSLVAANLAITFAQQKYSTLLMDCDLRRGVLHNTFASKRKPGLSDILISNKPITLEYVSQIIQKTHIPNLYLLSYGTPVPNPSELLGSSRMEMVYNLLKEKFGILILDTAPLYFTPDAYILNSLVHNVLLVVKYGKTSLYKLQEKTKELVQMKNDIVGVVINGSREVKSHDYYYSYYQY